MGGGPAARGSRPTANFYPAVLTSKRYTIYKLTYNNRCQKTYMSHYKVYQYFQKLCFTYVCL